MSNFSSSADGMRHSRWWAAFEAAPSSSLLWLSHYSKEVKALLEWMAKLKWGTKISISFDTLPFPIQCLSAKIECNHSTQSRTWQNALLRFSMECFNLTKLIHTTNLFTSIKSDSVTKLVLFLVLMFWARCVKELSLVISTWHKRGFVYHLNLSICFQIPE